MDKFSSKTKMLGCQLSSICRFVVECPSRDSLVHGPPSAVRQCQLGRATVDVAGLLGHPVGTQFKLHAGSGKQRLMRPEPVEQTEDLADAIGGAGQ